jgi:large subunit ribosomal protein L22
MKASLKNYRQSPRKVRLVGELVKGKSVDQAVVALNFLTKRAGEPIKKLILSALANAKTTGVEQADLFVKEIRVDKGIVMKRMMPRAMGRGARINKRTSHVTVELAERAKKAPKKAKAINTPEKTEIKEVKARKVSTKTKQVTKAK